MGHNIAIVITPSGDVDRVDLPIDNHSRLARLQEIVGGYVEVISMPGRQYMLVNEDGKRGPHEINATATSMAHAMQAIAPDDYIAGVAAIISTEALQ